MWSEQFSARFVGSPKLVTRESRTDNAKAVRKVQLTLEVEDFAGEWSYGLPGGEALLQGVIDGYMQSSKVGLSDGDMPHQMALRPYVSGEPSKPATFDQVLPRHATVKRKRVAEDEYEAIVRVMVELPWTDKQIVWIARNWDSTFDVRISKDQAELNFAARPVAEVG